MTASPSLDRAGSAALGRGLFWLQAAVIVLAGWWVYAPAFHGQWLWDDRVDIIENGVLRDPAGLEKIWAAPSGLDYYPLKTSVQWVQWRLWGMDSFGYHLTNVGLHLLSAFLLWYLLRRLGVKLAWLGGLLFTVHPLAVESVAWVVELKNTLSLPLLLGAMIAWVKWDARREVSLQDQGRDGRPARPDSAGDPGGARTGGPPVPTYILSVVLFLAALLSKTSVVMFPLVLLLYAWWKRGRISRRDLLASAPFFALSLALGLVTVWFQHYRALAGSDLPLGGWLARAAAAGMMLQFYFSKCIFPVGLMPIYPRWTVRPLSPLQFLPWLAFAILLFVMWQKRATWGRHGLLGLGSFLLNLAPVLGFVPMAYLRIAWVADHLAYLPLVSAVGLAAAAFGMLSDDPSSGVQRQAMAGLLAALAIVGLAWQSHRLAGLFRSEEGYWNYALRQNSQAWPAHNNLGITLANSGRLPEAIGQYEAALRLQPDNPETHYNLGNALEGTGRLPEAIAQYEIALRLQPNLAQACFKLGCDLAAVGRLPEAIARYEQALRLAPDMGEAHTNLGLALVSAGRPVEAMAHYQEALRLEPDNAETHNDLGVVLAEMGRLAEASGEFAEALRLKPGYANARNNLDRARQLLGQKKDDNAAPHQP